MGVIKNAIHKLKGEPIADDIFVAPDQTEGR